MFVWNKVLVHKQAVPIVLGKPLQRHCYQIAKTSFRQKVLIREESVIRFHFHPDIVFHRGAEDGESQFPGLCCHNRFTEENPYMRSVPGPRPLNICRNSPLLTDVDIRQDIVSVTVFAVLIIEIGTEKETGIVLQDGIQADDVRFSGILMQVSPYCRFVQKGKLSNRAPLTPPITTFGPTVLTNGTVPGAAISGYEALGIYILTAMEQTAEKRHPSLQLFFLFILRHCPTKPIHRRLWFAQYLRIQAFQPGILLLQLLDSCAKTLIFCE